MLIGTAWVSRVAIDRSYLLGIAVPMVIFGLGQGLGLSSLTTAGMAGVEPPTRASPAASSTSSTTSAARSASASS